MVDANNSRDKKLDVEAVLLKVEKLQSDRVYRDVSGLFYVEGVRNFIRVIDRRFDVTTILYNERLLTAPIARKLVRRSRRESIPTLSVTPEQFRRISHTERASGVGAIVRQPWLKLQEISPQAGLCWVVLETVRSPGNLGTLIRSSEAFGGAGFIFVGKKIDPFAADVIRASMGSLFNQKLIRTDFATLRAWMHRQACHAIGASPDGNTDLHQFGYSDSITLLFLGEERKGLTEQQRKLCENLVRIPMVGEVDSLNLAVAGSLLLYEVYRSKVFLSKLDATTLSNSS
jgi:RNA methyltransferase, TrmH family